RTAQYASTEEAGPRFRRGGDGREARGGALWAPVALLSSLPGTFRGAQRAVHSRLVVTSDLAPARAPGHGRWVDAWGGARRDGVARGWVVRRMGPCVARESGGLSAKRGTTLKLSGKEELLSPVDKRWKSEHLRHSTSGRP